MEGSKMQNNDKQDKTLSDRVYSELNELVNSRFQIMVNKDASPRELYRANVAQVRDFRDVSEESVLELVELTDNPYFVLNNFVGGDVLSY